MRGMIYKMEVDGKVYYWHFTDLEEDEPYIFEEEE